MPAFQARPPQRMSEICCGNHWVALRTTSNFIAGSHQEHFAHPIRVPPILAHQLLISSKLRPRQRKHHPRLSLATSHANLITATNVFLIWRPWTRQNRTTPMWAWRHINQPTKSLNDLSQLRATQHCSSLDGLHLKKRGVGGAKASMGALTWIKFWNRDPKHNDLMTAKSNCRATQVT
jgi:hypothetical protein